MTNRQLAEHIYFYSQNCKLNKSDGEWTSTDDMNVISYISNLIELNSEPVENLGSKGFLSISKLNQTDIREGFGC